MKQRQRVVVQAWTVLGVLFVGACSVAIGVDDYDFDSPQNSAGSSTSSGSGGTGSSSSSTSGSSSGMCADGVEKLCDEVCRSLSDPNYGCADPSCAPCNIPNAQEMCMGGACAIQMCSFGYDDCEPAEPGCETNINASDPEHCGSCTTVCPNGATCCGDVCSKLTDDPLNCGSCGNECDYDEYCSNSQCLCRPGLTKVGTSCRDLQSDVNNCGAQGTICTGMNALCESGACVPNCVGAGHTKCDDGCVDFSKDMKHCGMCDNSRCDVDEICSGGSCINWRPVSSVGCASCPCAACATVLGLPNCTTYPGTMMQICAGN